MGKHHTTGRLTHVTSLFLNAIRTCARLFLQFVTIHYYSWWGEIPGELCVYLLSVAKDHIHTNVGRLLPGPAFLLRTLRGNDKLKRLAQDIASQQASHVYTRNLINIDRGPLFDRSSSPHDLHTSFSQSKRVPTHVSLVIAF